jgi:GNAT superfamily N-acetyltransferase
MTDRAHGSYTLSDDIQRVDLGAVHAYLRRAYWCEEIPFDVVRRSAQNSLCIGAYDASDAQAGFARFISDYATFCYVCDVYVLDEHRGHGLARAMLSFALEHPKLHGLRRWMLVTRDAHQLYRHIGFRGLAHPERHMEINVLDIYKKQR